MGLVLYFGSTGGPGPDEDEAAGAGLRERRERVAAEQRVGGEGVRAQAFDRAVGALGLAHERLGVGLGRDRDVAALGVGNDQQAGLLGRSRRGGQGGPAGGAEA